MFSSLLNNRHFLIVFVHALEQQKDLAQVCIGPAAVQKWGKDNASWVCRLDPRLGQFAGHRVLGQLGISPESGPEALARASPILPLPGPACPGRGSWAWWLSSREGRLFSREISAAPASSSDKGGTGAPAVWSLGPRASQCG